jgi:hypothetical protein
MYSSYSVLKHIHNENNNNNNNHNNGGGGGDDDDDNNNNNTYLLTPWSRVLLEKLTGFAASQEIPRIYGTPKFITVPTGARHLSLS